MSLLASTIGLALILMLIACALLAIGYLITGKITQRGSCGQLGSKTCCKENRSKGNPSTCNASSCDSSAAIKSGTPKEHTPRDDSCSQR